MTNRETKPGSWPRLRSGAHHPSGSSRIARNPRPQRLGISRRPCPVDQPHVPRPSSPALTTRSFRFHRPSSIRVRAGSVSTRSEPITSDSPTRGAAVSPDRLPGDPHADHPAVRRRGLFGEGAELETERPAARLQPQADRRGGGDRPAEVAPAPGSPSASTASTNFGKTGRGRFGSVRRGPTRPCPPQRAYDTPGVVHHRREQLRPLENRGGRPHRPVETRRRIGHDSGVNLPEARPAAMSSRRTFVAASLAAGLHASARPVRASRLANDMIEVGGRRARRAGAVADGPAGEARRRAARRRLRRAGR